MLAYLIGITQLNGARHFWLYVRFGQKNLISVQKPTLFVYYQIEISRPCLTPKNGSNGPSWDETYLQKTN